MKKLLSVLVLISIFLLISAASFSASEKITLNFLEVHTSPSRTELLKEIISDFEEIHPDIQINLISPPYEQADQKATLMLNANEALDIIEVKDVSVKQFVNNNKLLNLENYIASWPDSKTLLPNAWQAARAVNDTAYYMPGLFYFKALFYRTDIVGENFVPPDTMSKLFEICKEITDPLKNQYGLSYRGKAWENEITDLFASSFLDDLDPNNGFFKTDGEIVFKDPRYMEGLKFYISFFHETAPKDAINWGFNETVNAFVSGTSPFLPQDPDTVALLDNMLGRDKYTTAPMPVGPSGKLYYRVATAGLGIPSYSKYKDEAWEFIEYFLSPKVNEYFTKNYGPLPVHSVTYKDSTFFSTGVYQAYLYTMEHPEKYVSTRYPTDSPKWPGWAQIHEADMQSLLLGKTTIEEVLDKWTEYWQ